MTNNTIRVTPTSRGNFSKLRKYKEGGDIPKYQTGATGLEGIQRQYTNTGYTSGSNAGWSESIFTPEFLDKLFSEIINPNTTPERRKELIQAINATQQAYEDLRRNRNLSSPAQKEQAVKEYLERIIREYPALNQIGIANGVNTGRYTYAKNRITGDNAGSDGSWSASADGVYGALTNDRTILGYDGNWDELGDRFKQMNESLRSFGYQVSKGLNGNDTYNNAYYINELNNPIQNDPSQNSIKPDNTQITNQLTPTVNQEKTWNPTEYSTLPGSPTENLRKKLNLFTDPIINGATLGLSLMNNQRVYDLATKLKTPLMQYTPLHDIWTGDYTYLTGANNAFANRYAKANLMALTSNSDYNYAVLKEAADAVMQGLMQAAEHQSQTYDQLAKEHVNVENTNKQGYDKIANYNRLSNITAYNNLLNAQAQLSLKNTEALQDNIMKNHAGYGQWLLQQRLQDYADWQATEGAKVQADLDKAYDIYRDSQDVNKFTEGWQGVLSGIESGDINNDSPYLAYSNWAADKGLDLNSIDALQQYYKYNSKDAIFSDFNDKFNLRKNDAFELYLKDYTDINRSWGLTQSRYKPITYDNQGTRWLDNLTPKPSYTSYYKTQTMKSGGKFTDRFLEYLDHNRQVQDKEKDIIMQASKLLKDLLKRDLDALDRETLLLLRSIFK